MKGKDHETFIKSTTMDFSAEKLFQWHRNPGALERYNPPWDPMEVVEKKGGIDPGSRVKLKMKAGPFRYTWEAVHTEMEEGRSFTDRQVKGPFALWSHEHRFTPGEGGSARLDDRIDYRFPFHPLSRYLLGRGVRRKLERIFSYRHALLEGDLESHRLSGVRKPMKIVISGSSGLIGSALVPFLTTGGHQVTRLVRSRPGEGESFWDPYRGVIDESVLSGADAVIHLSGDNIGSGRWSPRKKKLIIDSRVIPTGFLSRVASGVKKPPRVFISASAIGFYGNRGGEILTEESGPGKGFIPHVCKSWEESAKPAVEKGIRTVFIRLGVVLTPAGGALKRLLLPFSLGAGGRMGRGDQFFSWLTIDDVLGGLLHILGREGVKGPVNLVSPGSVTNARLTRVLSSLLGRPAFMHLPEKVITALFGEMGREVLLWSARVRPGKLEESGYRFRHPDLETGLKYLLGR